MEDVFMLNSSFQLFFSKPKIWVLSVWQVTKEEWGCLYYKPPLNEAKADHNLNSNMLGLTNQMITPIICYCCIVLCDIFFVSQRQQGNLKMSWHFLSLVYDEGVQHKVK